MAQLWGGRFTKETDQLVYAFNASIGFDQKFFREDVEGSRAHVKMLAKQKIISQEDRDAILKGLDEILYDVEHHKLEITEEYEDIHSFVEAHKGKYDFFPLFCGYRIPGGGVHWQAMMIFMEDLPIVPIRVGTGKNRLWFTDFKQGAIQWAETEDISYKYFFGRGSMPEDLANKKVLIIGVGAIGSIIAETLTRCGAKNLTLHDIDIKEPGNVCRSAYPFYTSINEKTLDLELLLKQISPHVECASLKSEFDLAIKGYAATSKDVTALAGLFDEFDVIFDCTTDNQLMRVMDAIETKAQVVNLSITNHAQDLICAFSPNVTETVLLVYGLLKRDVDADMYNPTGCWNPTFKASYNDISSKAQYAMKHIIRMLSGVEPKSNFYITEDEMDLNIHRL
jgi:hypothetical protein